MKTCKDCDNFIGCGDWDLCCKNPPEDKVGYCGFLCYEDTPACENFKAMKALGTTEPIKLHSDSAEV